MTDAERLAQLRDDVRRGYRADTADWQWVLDQLAAAQRERDDARETIAVLQREVERIIASNRIDAERI